MFNVLPKSLRTGVVTTAYPKTRVEPSARVRGRPEIDWSNWKDARPAAAICPTGAISFEDTSRERTATLDLGKCIFCGLCADVDKAIRMTNVCECAVRSRPDLITTARYALTRDGTHERMLGGPSGGRPVIGAGFEAVGEEIKVRASELL